MRSFYAITQDCLQNCLNDSYVETEATSITFAIVIEQLFNTLSFMKKCCS